MSEHLTVADFSKNLNTKFKVFYSEEKVFEAKLVEVLELKNNETLETFSVVWLLPADFGFEQRVFKIEHSELGTMELFIVPVGQNESGIRYEAVFNRLKK